ncbi:MULTISPECIES: caspase family protein [unclassified Fibrobacter]|uniref:caspase family protein n=1 Tax=unclassified Fibrobacter TaxID=2634177 RepID=UPI000D6A9469|nr:MULTISPECIES: caspase family protein [unclassified Fibrobacter]PWJ70063.1 caspase domain-containing protein [Fibrobacter sp. UWR4]PZW73411.1 caspase domain-containing protein [Fibrobacter sp. UWR1]
MFRSAINTFISLCGFGLIALLGLASFSHAAENNTIDRYVIAISANNGGSNRPMLRYAESDAKSFANVLKDMGGVKPQNLILIQEPSVSFLNSRMEDLDKILVKNQGKNGREEVLVYYSGHADEKGLRLGNEVYAWSEFRKRVDNLSADVKIAVIDACGSGAITRAKGGVAVPAFMIDQSSDMKGYAFITSSTQDESSQESDKLKGSFFTHSLVSGLRGAGDLSGDGKVTLSEAYQFAFNETLQKTQSTMGGAQHPSRDMNLAGTGDVVMTDLRSMGAGVSFHKDLDGRLFIRDDKGSLVAELYKAAGRNMSLGLPAGAYEIHLEKSAVHKTASVNLSNGKIENVSLALFKDVNVEKTVARGELGGKRSCANGDSVMCSLDSLDHSATFRTTFNAVDKDTLPRKGLQIGVFTSLTTDYMIGGQLSLFVNASKKEMHGIQVAGVADISRDHIEGAQISGIVNYAGSFDGLQLSHVNIAKDNSEGVQISTVNLALDTLSAVQVGAINYAGYVPVQVGAVNVAGASDIQVSSINVAASVEKTMVGAINVAGSNNSVDVGAINVAGSSKGRQIGVINICGNCEKTPIGLINIVGNGVWTASGIFNEMGGTGIKLDLGTAYFYTSFETSRNFKEGHLLKSYDDIWEDGFGVGTHFGMYGHHFALEYMFLNVADKYKGSYGGSDEDDKFAFHHRIRLGATSKLLPGVGLTGGLSLNLASRGYADRNPLKPLGEYHDDFGSERHAARFWPGFYAGLTVGRF